MSIFDYSYSDYYSDYGLSSSDSLPNIPVDPEVEKRVTKKAIKTVRIMLHEMDKNGDNKLDLEEFAEFSQKAIGLNEEQAKIMFDGIDSDNSKDLDINELVVFFYCTTTFDLDYLAKMIFRGADKERTGFAKLSDLEKAISGFKEGALTASQIEEQCLEIYGEKKDELEFYQFYRIFVGKEIDKDTDPYEGRLKFFEETRDKKRRKHKKNKNKPEEQKVEEKKVEENDDQNQKKKSKCCILL